MTHSKGPWKIRYADRRLAVGPANGLGILCQMTMHETKDEELANARLIASAPDMLAALEAGLLRLKEIQETTGYPTAWPQVLFESAIKKAKGE